MAKPIAAMVKLQVPAGQATPAPPVGTALGPHGVNIMEFVKQFNAKTAQAQGMVTPVEVTIFKDRTFTFITKTPPAAVLLKKEAGIEKGSPTSNRQKAGKVTRAQVHRQEGPRAGDRAGREGEGSGSGGRRFRGRRVRPEDQGRLARYRRDRGDAGRDGTARPPGQGAGPARPDAESQGRHRHDGRGARGQGAEGGKDRVPRGSERHRARPDR